LVNRVAVNDGRPLNGGVSALMGRSNPSDGAFSLNGRAVTTAAGRGSLRADVQGFIGGIVPVLSTAP
jgi:hypothetical protein